MPRTYTDDLSAQRDKVRLLALDTQPETAWFTDDEVDGAITMGGSTEAAAAILLKIKAARYAMNGNSVAASTMLSIAEDLDPVTSVASLTTPPALPFDPEFTES